MPDTPVCSPESCNSCKDAVRLAYEAGRFEALKEAESQVADAIANILWRMRNS